MKPRGKPFQKGNTLAKGGPREGAGPKPSWFKEQCRHIAASEAALKMLKNGIEGEPIDVKVLKNGTVLRTPPNYHDRVYAWEKVKDAGFGKLLQLEGKDGEPLGVNFYLPEQLNGRAGKIKDGD